MIKINSRQRRSNRFVPLPCGYAECACSEFSRRWTIAYDRDTRRIMRRTAQGKSVPKALRPDIFSIRP